MKEIEREGESKRKTNNNKEMMSGRGMIWGERDREDS